MNLLCSYIFIVYLTLHVFLHRLMTSSNDDDSSSNSLDGEARCGISVLSKITKLRKQGIILSEIYCSNTYSLIVLFMLSIYSIQS